MDTCIMWRMWILDSLVKIKVMLVVSGILAGIAGGIWLVVREDNKNHPDEAKWLRWSIRLLIYCPISIIVGVLMPTGEALTGYKDRVQQYRERRQHEVDLAMREERLKLEMHKLMQARLELEASTRRRQEAGDEH